MFTRVTIFLCFALLALGQVTQPVTVSTDSSWNNATGTFRALTVVSSPDGWIITGVKAQASTGGGSGQLNVDGARFAVGNGQASSPPNPPAFYLGVLAASATISTSGSVWSGTISGTFAEVVAAFHSILVYYDGDGTPGFQYTLGTDMWTGCCGTGAITRDCTCSADNIALANLTWSPVYHVYSPCSNPAYPTGCGVHSFYMIGNQAVGGATVAKLNFTCATHPVLVNTLGGNQIEVNPDKCKVDIDITYPWASKTNPRTNPQIALLVFAAGRSASGSVNYVAGGQGVSWTGATGAVTSFNWAATASVNGNLPSNVYAETITGQQITNFTCGLIDLVCQAIMFYLKTAVALLAVSGWASELLLFSWTDVSPALVSWDPDVTHNTASAGMLTTMPLVVLLLAMVYHRVFA